MDSLEWFWQTDRVIAVLHVAGGRGAAIHQLISFSPEVPKRKSIEIHDGAAHINQEGIGYRDHMDSDSQFTMHVGWTGQASGRYPASVMDGRDLESIRHEISQLSIRDGTPITAAVASGGVIAYRSYPGLDAGGQIWPNRRVVAVYHGSIATSLREWHWKGLRTEAADWQLSHLASSGYHATGGGTTVLDYYAMCGSGSDATHLSRKEFLHQSLSEMRGNMEAMLAHRGTFAIEVNGFFVEDWMPRYLELCEFCGITPNVPLATEFMHAYMPQQWARA